MNSRQKGKRGEREAAKILNAHFGLTARRGVQFQGGIDSPDVRGVWDGTHAEIKRVENLDIYAAIDQAVRDSGGKVPFVMHRKNNKPWLVTVRVEDLAEFIRRIKEHKDEPVF
jgi:Holliday junction resolvase